jgi:Uma2 family endonuclease
MPVALTTLSEPPIPLIPPRKRWTRAECELLESAGVKTENLELIEGELIDKMPKYRPHVALLRRMQVWLEGAFGQDRVNSEAPIDVAPADNPTNQPQPDLIVFMRPGGAFEFLVPQSAELALVVEISDTTLRFDLKVKANLYARAGIADYWVLDINGRRLIVHRDPTPAGYGSVVAYGESERVSPLAASDRELLVDDICPA